MLPASMNWNLAEPVSQERSWKGSVLLVVEVEVVEVVEEMEEMEEMEEDVMFSDCSGIRLERRRKDKHL